MGRDTNLGSGAPTTPPSATSTTGVYVNGGALNINSTLQFSNGTGTNSSSNLRMDSGSVIVGGVTTVASNAAGRYNLLNINGGTFTDNDNSGVGIKIGGQYTDSTQDSELLLISGTLDTPAITLGDATQTGGNDNFFALGGVTYIGAGGIVAGGATGTTLTVDIGGSSTAPVIAASANWSSSRPMTLANSTGGSPVIFQTANASGTPFNITLSGALSGGGLTQTGGGILTLSGDDTYTGATAVMDGVLEITGTLSGTASVTVASGATLYLAGGGLAVAGPIANNGIFKLSGATTVTTSGTFTNNGVLDLINGTQTLPGGFVNNGVVLYATAAQIQQYSISGSTFTLTIQGYAQHTYQLQNTLSLDPPITWTNVGPPQTGTGSQLNFSQSGTTGPQGFFRILFSP